MAQFGVYFDFSIYLLHKNIAIVAKPSLGSPGKEYVVQFWSISY